MSNEVPWLVAARKDAGLKEIVGSKHEPRILEFFAEAGAPYVKNDETAWCAAFVGAKLAEVGIKGTGALNARSYLSWGQALKTPAPGAITVFKRGSSTWQGHVAMFLRDLGSQIEVLGGNQSNSVSVARYTKSNVLGYRWPTGYALPVSGPAKPAAPAGPHLEIGSTGSAVKSWQNGLNVAGAKPVLTVDGDFGPASRKATLAFQKSRALHQTGVVTEADWLALDAYLEHLG